ncbi:MAG: sigma 54-interacting transcriptional regulator [Planctomycetes bacterium]|nr:sigma 54-interacting transcriptional regulator [Planctomycetota bacterium]
MGFLLFVVDGPDRGRQFALAPGEHVVGRDTAAGVRLTDRTTSRNHFKLVVSGTEVRLADLGRRNDTLVNGRALRQGPLTVGDRIEVGATCLELRAGAAASAAGANAAPTETAPVASAAPGSDPSLNSTVTIRLRAAEADPGAGPTAEALPAAYRRAHRDLTTLYMVAKALHVVREIDRLGVLLVETMLDVTEADAAYLFLLAGTPPKPALAASRTRKGDASGEPPVTSATLFAEVLRDGTSVLATDAQADPRLAGQKSVVGQQIRSALCVPVRSQDRVLGLLQLHSTRKAGAHGEEDLRLATAIGNQAGIAIENARLQAELRAENANLAEALVSRAAIVGKSPEIERVLKLVGKVAASDVTVLIQGESGTGKELIAQSVHYTSPRKGKPLICVNCGAIPETLVESELFGHEKGAFTGAVARKPGHFERADGGTLFLDEIGELSAQNQVKLLRVLETGRFERVGGTETLQVSVRVLAATNRDLEAEVRKGSFREDLYYRLGVVQVEIPPLRERRGDIPLLIDHFLETYRSQTGRRITGVSPDAQRALRAYDWPGNVRELRNCMDRAVVIADGPLIQPEDLPSALFAVPRPGDDRLLSLDELEREHIRKVLRHTAGNKKKAAEILGIERSTLYKKLEEMRQLGMTP